MLDYLLELVQETGFIGSNPAIVMLAIAIGTSAFFKFRELLSDWDPKRKKREHHKFRIGSLEALKSANTEEISDFIIGESDTALVRSLKEQIWDAYDAKYIFVDELGPDKVSKLRFPLTTVEAYVRGRQALSVPTENSENWSIKSSSIFLQRASFTLLIGGLICISVSLSSFLSLIITELTSIDSVHSLGGLIMPSLIFGAFLAAAGYALTDNIKHVINAHRFKRLWSQRIENSEDEQLNSHEESKAPT